MDTLSPLSELSIGNNNAYAAEAVDSEDANQSSTNHVSANHVSTNHVSANHVSANLVSANHVSANHVSANHVSANHLNSNQLNSNHLSWEEYFMAVAFLTAQRSKDPVTQVGACIVNSYRHIVGVGYNGMPNGCSDKVFPWGKASKDPTLNKYMYVCHAEMNAITNKNSADVSLCSLYVTLFPCNECAKLIIQSGIKKVVYYSDKHADKASTIGSKIMLQHSGVEFRKYGGEMKRFKISFQEIISKDLFLTIRENKRHIPQSLTTTLEGRDSSQPRAEYLKWGEYFMSMALLSAQRSKDPHYATREGACIVDQNNRIVGIGYNGMPTGCADSTMPWVGDGTDPLMSRHLYVCHAAMNAITNKNRVDMSECVLYSTHHPCNDCAKLIIQSGLREVRYLHREKGVQIEAAEILFSVAGVNILDYRSKCDQNIFGKINTNFEEVRDE